MVGLIPLFAVETLEPQLIDKLAGFKRRMEWFIENRPDLTKNVACMRAPRHGRAAPAVHRRTRQLRRVLQFMLDENEFLSPYGIRALSRYHMRQPLPAARGRHRVHAWTTSRRNRRTGTVRRQLQLARADLVPGQLSADRIAAEVSSLPGRRISKWNVPTGSGQLMTLWEVAAEISRRLTRIFLRDETAAAGPRRAPQYFQTTRTGATWSSSTSISTATTARASGASHQTGWTGLVAKLLQQSGE